MIYTEAGGVEIRIPAVQPLACQDRWEPGTPTAEDLQGTGTRSAPETCGRIGSTIASFKLEVMARRTARL